jgi:F-type H+-transporting ATPase subunit b
LINERKNAILKNLQDADNKLREAEENLAFARKNLELAKSKSEQIRNQGLILSGQTSKVLLDSVEEDIKRLKSSSLSSIKFEEEKSINEVCQKLTYLAFTKSVENLTKRLSISLQKRIVTQGIDKLSVKFLTRR